jgi:hypothetical protein
MFHVDWILQRAQHVPDPHSKRRPALIPKALRGRPIVPEWPVQPELRTSTGTYPRHADGLDHSQPGAALPSVFGEPGSRAWAAAAAVIDSPLTAVRMASPDGTRRVHLLRAFREEDRSEQVVAFDLVATAQGRGHAEMATIEQVVIIAGSGDDLVERLRIHLERIFLDADPNFRERSLRADGAEEPMLLVVSADPDDHVQARAVAATFGARAEAIRENIARDHPRLRRALDRVEGRLMAVALCERSDKDVLAWISDRIRAAVDTTRIPVERIRAEAAGDLRMSLRLLMAISEAEIVPQAAVALRTCPRCQPEVSRLIGEGRLSVSTAEAGQDQACICGGRKRHGASLRLSFACRLADISEVVIVGYQENFSEIFDDVAGANITHLHNAVSATTLADRSGIAIILPGSRMGHAESAGLLNDLEAKNVRVIEASGPRLTDAYLVLIDLAIERNPALLRKT